MQSGRLAVVKVERQNQDGYSKALLVEVAFGKELITISDQGVVPMSAPIREQAEKLIELVMQEQSGEIT
jgi:hypothetical protein